MGLHSGTPVRTDEGYVGLDVHRAARIAASGYGGQVLLSSDLASAVGGNLPSGCGLRDLGEHWLKDLDAPEPLYQLVIPGLPEVFPPPRSLAATSALPPLTPGARLLPLAGRIREMETLRVALATALAG